MELVGIVISFIAAVAAIANMLFTITNSKGYILKRIDHKEQEISKIDIQIVNKFGLNRGRGGGITPLDAKRIKLEEEIEELKRKL